jgi:hypothetical protein
MTRRATFTEAEIVRFGRAADKLGKVLVITLDGAVFADPETVAVLNLRAEEPNTCDIAFGLVSPPKPQPW